MEKQAKRPMLLFFQWNHAASPDFIKLHMQLHVKCLSEYFYVKVINEDCDYNEVCDIYRPDLCLFESGYRTSVSRKIVIKNTSSHKDIPKLGLHNGDPWCDCRVGFISDMERWGIETFFSISTSTAEHTPEIAERLFVWPNFIDSDIFHDYKQTKVIPVLFNGSINAMYPWRERIFDKVSKVFPSLIFPHLGYESKSSLMILGEEYARTINASWFVPACGTVAKEIVRKHFEIPGSRACLITEKTPIIEAAGFIDMQNCLFADDNNVIEKLDYLLENKDQLNRILDNGYKLVHSHHTIKQRDQIFQWFSLNKDLKKDEKIVQINPFEPLRVVSKSSIKNLPIRSEGTHLEHLHRGDAMLWVGNYVEAEASFKKCLSYIYYMREPMLKLAICNLYQGKPGVALQWITKANLQSFRYYKSVDPDPIEWTYLIISLLCQGKLKEAVIRADQFHSLNHFEVKRICWVVKCLQNEDCRSVRFENQVTPNRNTIHQLPELEFEKWVDNVCDFFRACKQFGFIKILGRDGAVIKKSKTRIASTLIILFKKNILRLRIEWIKSISITFEKLRIPDPWPGLPPISEMDFLIRIGKCLKINNAIKFILRLHQSRKTYLKRITNTMQL